MRIQVLAPVVACGSLLLLSGCILRQEPAVAVYEPPPTGPYSLPLISPGTKFAALPPAVQHTIRSETGGAEIEDVVRDTAAGTTVYKIFFAHPESSPPLYLAPDGSVLNPDLTVAMGASQDSFGSLTGGARAGLALGDLPPKVVTLIQERAPSQEIQTITKENRGEQVVYIVTFKGPKETPLEITSEGAIVTAAPAIHIPERRKQ